MRNWGCLALCLIWSPAALAQPEPDEVIIVSGDRLGEARSAAALSVGVIDAAEISDVAAEHPAELLNRQAGVFIHRGNGAEHLTAIRSPVLTGGAGAGSFLYLEDGVPLRAAGFANVNGLFEDLGPLAGGVEVVRGPGPALYGSNALHGLVNTLTPAPEDTRSRLVLEAGSFGRRRGELVLARPGEPVSSLLAVSGLHEDGWRDEAGLDHVRALVRADGQAGGVDWRLTAGLVLLEQETAGYASDYRDRSIARGNADPEAFRNAQAGRIALRVSAPLAEGWTWSLTPYARANSMDFLMHFLPSEALETSGHQSLGVQGALSRRGGAVDWTFGLDLEHTRGWLDEYQDRPTIFSFVQGDHYDYSVTADVAALYTQARWQATQRLDVTAGVRLEATRFEYDNHLPDGSVGRFLRLPDRSDDYVTLAPSLGAVYALDEAAVLFARMARGVRAPQTAELYRLQPGQTPEGIDPEEIDSLELGYRRSLGGVRLEVVGFAMHKRNVFFRDADGFNVTDAQTDHQGVEFDIAWPVTRTVELGLTGTWAEHTYAYDRPVGRASESVSKGDRVDSAPDWLWTARLDWQVTGATRLGVEWQHVGEYFTDAANTQHYEGHDLVNLRLHHRLGERVQAYASLRNLFDEAYAERADYAFGADRYFPGEPRRMSLGIRITG